MKTLNRIIRLVMMSLVFATSTQLALASNDTWSGNAGGGNGNWSAAGNWDNLPAATDLLFFDTGNQLLTTNDFSVDTQFNGITFNPDAGTFTLNGNEIILAGNIINSSTNLQTNNLPIVTLGTTACIFDAGTVGMMMLGSISNIAAIGPIILMGTNGVLSGPLLAPSGANGNGNLWFTITNAGSTGTNSWSILGNSVSVITNLTIQGGLFNFGSGNDSPSLAIYKNVSTGTDPLDVGNLAGTTGAFNMNSGTLTISGAGRFNVPNPAGCVGIFNQTGGTVTCSGGCPVEFANALTSQGALNLNGGTFDASGGTFDIALRGTGIVTVASNALLVVNNLAYSRVSSDANGANGTFNLNGGMVVASKITPNGTGAATGQSCIFNFSGGVLRIGASSTTYMVDSPAFTASISSGGAIIDSSNFSITISAPLQHDATGPAIDGGLTLLGTGTVNLAGASTYAGNTMVSNGVLYVDGSIAGNGVTIQGGSLGGIGTIAAPTTISANGTLSPGDDATTMGTLNFNDTLSLSGTNDMDLDKSGDALTSDLIAGVTSLTYGGTLNLNIIGDPLAAGDAFTLFQFTSASGAFAAIIPATPGDALAWDTSTLTTDGTLRVITASTKLPPHIVSFSLSGTNLIFSGTNGVAGGPYMLLTSTNVALPLTNWTPLLTNNFDGSGNFNFTNGIAPNTPQKFYILSQ